MQLAYRRGGGGYKTGGGIRSFTPTKRGTEKVLAMLKGGTKSFGVVFMQ